MSALIPHKVTALPPASAWTPNTIYYVSVGADKFDLFVTDNSGNSIRSLGGFLKLVGGNLSGDLGITSDDPTFRLNNSSSTNTSLLFLRSGASESSISSTSTSILFRRSISGGTPTDLQIFNDRINSNKAIRGVATQDTDHENTLVDKSYVDNRISSSQYAQVRNSDTTQNINTDAWAEIPLAGTTDFVTSDFEQSGNGIKYIGTVAIVAEIYWHVGMNSTGQRNAIKSAIKVNGVRDPLEGRTGYIRWANGHGETNTSGKLLKTLNPSDTVVVEGIRESTNGTATNMNLAGNSLLTIKKV